MSNSILSDKVYLQAKLQIYHNFPKVNGTEKSQKAT